MENGISGNIQDVDIDLIPDVAVIVSRRNEREPDHGAEDHTYESTVSNQPWFSTMLAAGDTHEISNAIDRFEGNITDHAIET
jgi:hypothetical protein